MDAAPQGALTDLLQAWGRGDLQARDRLLPLVYSALRHQAARYLRRERHAHSLQPTALVHEAYLRLASGSPVAWESRTHFFAVAAQAMRRILVDHARRRAAAKRAGGRPPVTLAEGLLSAAPATVEVIALDEALDQLSAVDAQQARIVELRFFGGLSIEETADVLRISAATVKRDWSMAKAWLLRRLRGGDPAGGLGA